MFPLPEGYWNGCPEAFAKVPLGEEVDVVEQLVELAGCSIEEAEAIATALEEGLYSGSLQEYNVFEGGIEIVSPSEKFLEELFRLFKELRYEVEHERKKELFTIWF